jgi:hypothetical protein
VAGVAVMTGGAAGVAAVTGGPAGVGVLVLVGADGSAELVVPPGLVAAPGVALAAGGSATSGLRR